MSNYNNKPYGTVEYYEEELKQKTLIAKLVKEAVCERAKQTNSYSYLIEELSIAVLSVTDDVKYAEIQLEEAKAKKGENNDE